MCTCTALLASSDPSCDRQHISHDLYEPHKHSDTQNNSEFKIEQIDPDLKQKCIHPFETCHRHIHATTTTGTRETSSTRSPASPLLPPRAMQRSIVYRGRTIQITQPLQNLGLETKPRHRRFHVELEQLQIIFPTPPEAPSPPRETPSIPVHSITQKSTITHFRSSRNCSLILALKILIRALKIILKYNNPIYTSEFINYEV
jgi:hypothetical protein